MPEPINRVRYNDNNTVSITLDNLSRGELLKISKSKFLREESAIALMLLNKYGSLAQ